MDIQLVTRYICRLQRSRLNSVSIKGLESPNKYIGTSEKSVRDVFDSVCGNKVRDFLASKRRNPMGNWSSGSHRCCTAAIRSLGQVCCATCPIVTCTICNFIIGISDIPKVTEGFSSTNLQALVYMPQSMHRRP